MNKKLRSMRFLLPLLLVSSLHQVWAQQLGVHQQSTAYEWQFSFNQIDELMNNYGTVLFFLQYGPLALLGLGRFTKKGTSQGEAVIPSYLWSTWRYV